MRASILAWSAASGAILGILIDATLIGVALLIGTLVPALSAKLHFRWFAIGATAVLASIPTVLTVLGYLEGELKLR
jgi:hypothetical protein